MTDQGQNQLGQDARQDLLAGRYDRARWAYDYLAFRNPGDDGIRRLLAVSTELAEIAQSLARARAPAPDQLQAWLETLENIGAHWPELAASESYRQLVNQCRALKEPPAASPPSVEADKGRPGPEPEPTEQEAVLRPPPSILPPSSRSPAVHRTRVPQPHNHVDSTPSVIRRTRPSYRTIWSALYQHWQTFTGSENRYPLETSDAGRTNRIMRVLRSQWTIRGILLAILAAKLALSMYIWVGYNCFFMPSGDDLTRATYSVLWSKQPDLLPRYHLWPTLPFWIFGIFLKMYPYPAVVCPTVNMLATVAALFLAYLIAKAVSGYAWFGVIAATLLAFEPLSIWLSLTPMAEPLATMFVMIGILAVVRYQQTNRTWLLVTSGIAFAFATACRLELAAFVVGFTVLLIVDYLRQRHSRSYRGHLIALLLACSFLASYFVSWWAQTGRPLGFIEFYKADFENSWLSGVVSTWQDRLSFFVGGLVGQWPELVILATASLVVLVKTKASRQIGVSMILLILLPFSLMVLIVGYGGMLPQNLSLGFRHLAIYPVLMATIAPMAIGPLMSRRRLIPIMAGIVVCALCWFSINNASASLYVRNLDFIAQIHAGKLAHQIASIIPDGYPRRTLVVLPLQAKPDSLSHDNPYPIVLADPNNIFIYSPKQTSSLPPNRALITLANNSPFDPAWLAKERVALLLVHKSVSIPGLGTTFVCAGEISAYQIVLPTTSINLSQPIRGILKSLPDWVVNYPFATISSTEYLELHHVPVFEGRPSTTYATYVKATPTGDFEAAVDFDALNLPSPPETGISSTRNEFALSAVIDDSVYRVARWQGPSAAKSSYVFSDPSNRSVAISYITDTKGKLRIRRVGDKLFGDYWRDGQWVNLGSHQIPADTPTFIRLVTHSSFTDDIAVRFSNFTITEGPPPTVTTLAPDQWTPERWTSNPQYGVNELVIDNRTWTAAGNNTGTPAAADLLSTGLTPAGGFSVTVDFDALTLPKPSQGRNDLSLSLVFGDQSFRIVRWEGPDASSYVLFGPSGKFIADVKGITDTSGKLRFRRVGDKLFGDYWRNGQWVNLGSHQAPTDTPAHVRLGTYSSEGDRVVVRFSNLSVSTTDAATASGLSPENWAVEKLPSNPIFSDGGVELNYSRPVGDAGIVSTSPLPRGDFSVSVDYRAVALPTPASGRNDFYLGVVIENTTFRICRWQDADSGRYFFQSTPDGKVNDVGGIGDMEGRLRLRRVGDRLYADYWRNGQWVNLGRRDGVPQGPAFIRLAIFGTQDGITVRFSNLTVER